MSRISVRGFAVASATAVTTVGAAVGVASGDDGSANDLEVVAADASLLMEIPASGNAQLHTSSLSQQAETQSQAAESAERKSAEETARLAAADQAAAKKAAAEKKAAEEKAEQERKEAEKAQREAEEAASRNAERSDPPTQVQSSYTKAELQALAREIVGGDQFQCFSSIVERESSWNHTAENPSSGAYGLVQAYPASKMSSVGDDWRTNPTTQIKWGLKYMNERYGSPCAAFEYWQVNHWY